MIRSSRCAVPSKLTSLPANSSRRTVTVSCRAVSGFAGSRSIWRSQCRTPRATPGRTRPGYIRARPANSIAVIAGWRVTAETAPVPTGIRSVEARIWATPAMPPEK